ncbi:MAG TPA: zinc-dependent alcohol dehydrogenase family protein [Pseudorhizobium sp.]|nr:zinc-dependent alcohol dehydrogenase family protein [Pseudorhizobium sp.]
MKAMLYDAFEKAPKILTLPDPAPTDDGVVIKVGATGLCRSDWHGWMGHDPDIRLPHVPGHELAGEVVATGRGVMRFKVGDRVTVPFVSGCGHCSECHSGNQQVCPNQFQPGFTHWGSFAEYVAIGYADTNLVCLPEEIDDATAASLGCRFATSFRAVADQARTGPGEWIAVHGCGGVGLSAIMIATALGANAIGIDLSEEKLELARACGAVATVNAGSIDDPVEAVREITKGGAHVSIDALGHPTTCFNSIKNLRRRGRHVQVGLMLGEHSTPQIPMAQVIGHELEIYGSHGMQAWRYDAMLSMIAAGRMAPSKLISSRISLGEAVPALMEMDSATAPGISVITRF